MLSVFVRCYLIVKIESSSLNFNYSYIYQTYCFVGRYQNGMISRQRSQVSYRDRSPTPVQNFDRLSNAKPRNITNFDMPVHRAGKRNINCRSATDNNIFNLQSLVNIRARGSGQPNQQINQRNQNKSLMARSASFVNLEEIKVIV